MAVSVHGSDETLFLPIFFDRKLHVSMGSVIRQFPCSIPILESNSCRSHYDLAILGSFSSEMLRLSFKTSVFISVPQMLFSGFSFLQLDVT